MSWHEGPISQVMPFVLHVIHWSSTLETWVPAMYQDEFTDWILLEQLKKPGASLRHFARSEFDADYDLMVPVLHVDVCWCLDDSLMILFELSSIMYESYRSIPLDMRGHTRTLRLCLQNSTPITLFVEDIAGIPGMLAAWCVNHLHRRWQPEANEAGVVSHDLVQPQAVWKPRACYNKMQYIYRTRRLFPLFFLFTPICGRFPFWLIFFRWVETTNYRIHLHQVR